MEAFRLFFVLVTLLATGYARLAPDAYRNVTDLISNRGYPFEIHSAVTADGFVLGIQRIPYGYGAAATRATRVPVLLQHGLMDSADSWVLNDRATSLAYLLADAGYDVWLGNSRANKYSKTNLWYSPSEGNYWAWNWDQLAEYDIPATVQYVAKVTNQPVIYIGHSQGATIGLAAQLIDPSLRELTRLQVLLAPVTYLAHESSPLFKTMVALHLDVVLKLLGNTDVTINPEFLNKIFGSTCSLVPALCQGALSSLFGDEGKYLNSSRVGVYLSHWPGATSVQNMLHWVYNARSGDYATFSGQSYRPAAAVIPTAVFSGRSDSLAVPADVNTLVAQLSPVLHKTNDFAHMDFVWSEYATAEVYQPILQLLSSYK